MVSVSLRRGTSTFLPADLYCKTTTIILPPTASFVASRPGEEADPEMKEPP